MRVGIVGAGAAGLSLAVMLKDHDVTVFEADEHPGGLCRSTFTHDCVFDIGPHILGGVPEAVDWIVDSTRLDFVWGKTKNVAWIDGKWELHPFMREQDVDSYMRKMWKCDHLLQAGLNAQKGRKPGGVAQFRYPRHGGYQAITDVWAAQLGDRIQFGERKSLADLVDEFDEVVWTGPRTGGRYNTLVTVTALCYGPRPQLTAIYLPDSSTLFHRLSFPCSFSSENAPVDMFIVQGEASFEREWELPEIDGLLEDLKIGSPEYVHYQRTPYAYPVPTVVLSSNGDGPIYHGRTGGYAYLNLDGVISESLRLAERLS